MQAITKDEQDALVGKGSFWLPKRAPGTLEYLHGLAEMDERRADSKLPNPLQLELRPGGLVLSVLHKFKRYYLAVPFDQLLGVSLDTPEAILTKKQKSILGRAVLTGVALGPVGAMLGALSGMANPYDVTRPDSLLTIEVATDQGPVYLVAGMSTGMFVAELRRWLMKHLTAYYRAE